MRILITGADGFVGRHACRVFRANGHEVFELRGSEREANEHARGVDLRRASGVLSIVEWARPEGVLHLAGASSVTKSHETPSLSFEVNALGSVHLLAALRQIVPRARVVLVSSGEVYGPLEFGHTALESDPTRPTSPYASSKLAAEIAAHQFGASYGQQIVIARPFNHLGVGQSRDFVVPSFVEQLCSVPAGGSIRVGNLDVVRDFSHVLDVVDAYAILLERGVPGSTYNVASGEGRTIRSLLKDLIEICRVDVQTVVDADRARSIEVAYLVGDATALRALGWQPQRTVRDALEDAVKERRNFSAA